MAADISVWPGVDSASKNEYQDIPVGKDGRCVKVTTLPPSCAECLVIWSLNRPEPSRPHRPVIGVALPLKYCLHRNYMFMEQCDSISKNSSLRTMVLRFCKHYMCISAVIGCVPVKVQDHESCQGWYRHTETCSILHLYTDIITHSLTRCGS